MTAAQTSTDYQLATLAAEDEAMRRDLAEMRGTLGRIEERSRDDSGRLARVETALGGLSDAVREQAAATREQTAELRGGITRAIGIAEDAARRTARNAERLDEHAAKIAAHETEIAECRKAASDRAAAVAERRRWWSVIVAGIVFLGAVGSAVKTWLDLHDRAAITDDEQP